MIKNLESLTVKLIVRLLAEANDLKEQLTQSQRRFVSIFLNLKMLLMVMLRLRRRISYTVFTKLSCKSWRSDN